MVSVGGSSQVSTRSRRLAPSGTSMSTQPYSPSSSSEIVLALFQPPGWSLLRTLVRADTLPSPYCICSFPGPVELSVG